MADMDLTTYSGLKQGVADFLDRDDLSEKIPGFIRLGEATINRRVRRRKVRATVSVTSGAYTLPSTVGELVSATPDYGTASLNKPLLLSSKQQIDDERARVGGVTGYIRRVARVGSELLFAPEPSATVDVELVYYEKLVPLSGSVSTNALLTESPDVYLYGALLAAAEFLDHDERVPLWQSAFDRAISEINTQRQREEFGGGPQRLRLPIVFG